MADQSTLKALRNKLSDLEDELDTAHEAQAELEKQLGQLKSDLEAKEEKLQSALTEAKDASERCASSEARLQKLSEAQDAPAEASSPPDSADQSEEVARLRAELQELQRSLKTSQMETKKLEEELKTAEQQQKEAVQQEKKRAEGLTSEIQQLQRSQQETAQAEAQKLKAVEAEYRNECQRLQQLCQELESDRDTALERMQRAEETLKQQMQQFQEFSKKNAAEARAGAEAMGKELEARNARIAQQQAELQRQAQAMAEEQRKAQELQEQLTAYVGTHQVGYTQIHLRRASSAEASFVGCHGFQGECEVQEVWMETLDHLLLGDVPPVDLLKIHVQGSELDVLRGAREALRQVIEAMRRFTFPGYIGSTRIRLRQAFLRLLVYEQPEAVLAPLRGAFLRLDRDSDGLLSAADLHGAGAGATTTSSSFLDALFGEASASPEDEEIRSLLAVSGGANGLGFSDFVAVMMPFCVSLEEAQCRLAFQRLAGAEVTLSRQVLVDTVQVGPDVPQAEVEAFHAGLPEELTFADFLELVRT